MANKDLFDGMAVFASSYVKRYLETHYDALMRTAPARKLMAAGKPTRYGIEAALYALVAYADQNWSPDTPLRRLVREVALDAPAELSKRLVNGFRDDVIARGAAGTPDETRRIEQTLLQLDDATLGPLLLWLTQMTPEDRARVRSLISRLSDDELKKIARLKPEELASLLSLSAPPSNKDVPERRPSRLAQTINDQLQEAHRRVDDQLAARRRRKKKS